MLPRSSLRSLQAKIDDRDRDRDKIEHITRYTDRFKSQPGMH